MMYYQKIKKKINGFIKSWLLAIVTPPVVTPPFFTKAFFKDKKFAIGEYTYGNPIVLFETEDTNLFIGKFCSISDNVTIFLGGNHRTDWVTTYPFNALNIEFPEAIAIQGHPATKGDVVIKNDVWIGRGVTILSGITIGNGAVIAAGSVITKEVGDYEIWGGNPAKLIKKRFDAATIHQLLELKWWDWEVSKIKDNVSNLCSADISVIVSQNNKVENLLK